MLGSISPDCVDVAGRPGGDGAAIDGIPFFFFLQHPPPPPTPPSSSLPSSSPLYFHSRHPVLQSRRRQRFCSSAGSLKDGKGRRGGAETGIHPLLFISPFLYKGSYWREGIPAELFNSSSEGFLDTRLFLLKRFLHFPGNGWTLDREEAYICMRTAFLSLKYLGCPYCSPVWPPPPPLLLLVLVKPGQEWPSREAWR